MGTTPDERFSFQMDAKANLVRARLRGMFQPEDVDRYFAAQRAVVVAGGCDYGRHLLLLDVRELLVQQQEVVAAFQQRLGRGAGAGRAALVCSSALLRLQINRLLGLQSIARVFDDPQEAEGWLIAP